MYPVHVAVKFWYFTWCQNATKHRAVLRWRIISKIHKLIIIKMVKEFWPNATPQGWSFRNLLIPLMGVQTAHLALGPTWVHILNSIWSSTIVFVGISVVTNTHRACCIKQSILCCAWWCGLTATTFQSYRVSLTEFTLTTHTQQQQWKTYVNRKSMHRR